jgi:hypothetical protein
VKRHREASDCREKTGQVLEGVLWRRPARRLHRQRGLPGPDGEDSREKVTISTLLMGQAMRVGPDPSPGREDVGVRGS